MSESCRDCAYLGKLERYAYGHRPAFVCKSVTPACHSARRWVTSADYHSAEKPCPDFSRG